MGIDLTVIKGYGVLVPLIGNEEVYDQLWDELDFHGSYPDYDFGVSGSYSMTGASDGDMIWFAPNRLLEYEDAKHSDGFIWTFDEESPTAAEVKTLQEIAERYFNASTIVKVEPFVTMSVS